MAISTAESYSIRPPSADDGTMPPSFDVEDGKPLPEEAIRQFEADGVICLRSVIESKAVDRLREEADAAVANPSEDARFVKTEGNPAMK